MKQSLKNHTRFFPPFHFFAVPLTLLGLGASVYQATKYPSMLAWLVTLLFFLVFIAIFFARFFSLKAQDRIIRTEENFRFFMITGKPLPDGIQISQIIALRFASDEEFVALTQRTLKENLSSKQIKESIKNWRADDYRI